MKAEIYLGLDKTTQVAYSTQLKVKGITFKTNYPFYIFANIEKIIKTAIAIFN